MPASGRCVTLRRVNELTPAAPPAAPPPRRGPARPAGRFALAAPLAGARTALLAGACAALLVGACAPLLGIDDVDSAGAAGQAGGGPAQGTGGAGPSGAAGAGGSGAAAGGGGSGAGGVGGAGGQEIVGFVRVANLREPGVGDPGGAGGAKFDLCLRLDGTNEWRGPILKEREAPPLAFEELSGYGALPPGLYDAIVVPALIDVCSELNAAAKLERGPLRVSVGSFSTLALAGPPLAPQIVPYEDGRPLPASVPSVEVSFANATPETELSVSFADGQQTISLAFAEGLPLLFNVGPWPVTEVQLDDIPHAIGSTPDLARRSGYTAFFIPEVTDSPAAVAILACRNTPPSATPAPAEGCTHIKLSPLIGLAGPPAPRTAAPNPGPTDAAVR